MGGGGRVGRAWRAGWYKGGCGWWCESGRGCGAKCWRQKEECRDHRFCAKVVETRKTRTMNKKSEQAWFVGRRCKMYAVRNAALFLAKHRPTPGTAAATTTTTTTITTTIHCSPLFTTVHHCSPLTRQLSPPPPPSSSPSPLHHNIPSIACQDLSEHVPDYRFISAHVRRPVPVAKATLVPGMVAVPFPSGVPLAVPLAVPSAVPSAVSSQSIP